MNWTLREPTESDWPAILQLANASLADMPNAPPQDEWLANRRAFLVPGRRHHLVAFEAGRAAGYAAAEHPLHAPDGEYRVFVVVAPSARDTLATYLLRELRRHLVKANASTIRMLEYETDAGFLRFLQAHGFVHRKTFTLADGVKVTELRMEAPFAALA